MERLEDLAARAAGTWVPETTAALVSSSSLAALVAVLVAANSKPILEWQWYNVTLNAVVSVLSTISRLSALFVLSSAIGQAKWVVFLCGPGSLLEFEAVDLASRGFVGCTQLLLRTRKIALVGALAVIAALAFDPFAQQLVRLRSQVVYATSKNATMPFTRRYAAGSLTFATATSFHGMESVSSNVDFGMASAVFAGLATDHDAIIGQSPLQCRTGNCTWTSVQSLAVCNVCNDVTHALRRSKTNQTALIYLSDLNLATVYGASTTFSLGNNVFLNNIDNDVGGRSIGGLLMMTAYGTGDPMRTTSLKRIDTLIWAAGLVQAVPDVAVNASWPTDFTVSATECGLYYCVKDYTVQMTQNKVNESSKELLSAKRVPGSWQYVDATARRRANDSMLQNLMFPFSGALAGWTAERTDLMLGDGFNLSQSAVLSLSAYMNQTFTRSMTQPYNPRYPTDADSLGGYYINYTDRFAERASVQYEPGVMQAFYDSQNLDLTFNGLAASMSNAIRAHRSSSTTATGELGQLVTSYRIVWPWIALPALVVIASIVQLALIVRASKNQRLWKSSTLATLSRGHCAQKLLAGASTLRDLRRAAGKQEVDLFDPVNDEYELQNAKSGTTSRVERDESNVSLLR